jgi:hypothetical protein
MVENRPPPLPPREADIPPIRSIIYHFPLISSKIGGSGYIFLNPEPYD